MSNDPTIIPTSARERKFLALADVRGLSIKRVPGSRNAVRLVGPGIDVRAAALFMLTDADFDLPRIKADPW